MLAESDEWRGARGERTDHDGRPPTTRTHGTNLHVMTCAFGDAAPNELRSYERADREGDRAKRLPMCGERQGGDGGVLCGDAATVR